MKTIWNFLKSKFFWINIAIAIGVFLVLLFGTLGLSRIYTHHGESVEVPDLTHMYIEEAELALDELGLQYEVVDSVYLRSFKPGEIAEQSPVGGTMVKHNRKIYITLNSREKQLVRVPGLKGESYRKAQSNLRALGFNADSVRYRPYEFNGEVLDLLYNGRSVEEGEKIADGSMIVLVVGKEDKEHQVTVPNLIGLTYDAALAALQDAELAVGQVSYDVKPQSDTERQQYKVFSQSPSAGESVYVGKLVEIKLSRTQRSANKPTEEFF